MARSLIWIQGSSDPGWACSSCRWKFPVPTLLSSDEAKSAYDRLAASKFRAHICETQTTPAPVKANTGPTFAERAGRLIKACFSPELLGSRQSQGKLRLRLKPLIEHLRRACRITLSTSLALHRWSAASTSHPASPLRRNPGSV